MLYLEGNGITKIEGLSTLANMRTLYLQENLIKRMEGLDGMPLISNLNLSDNCIATVEGLSKLTRLQNLQLKRNNIGINGLSDLVGLLECPSTAVVCEMVPWGDRAYCEGRSATRMPCR